MSFAIGDMLYAYLTPMINQRDLGEAVAFNFRGDLHAAVAAYAYWGIPEDSVREAYELYLTQGRVDPAKILSGHEMMSQAKTLRDRVFAQVVSIYRHPVLTIKSLGTRGLNNTAQTVALAQDYEIDAKRINLRSIIAAAKRHKETREHLANIPIIGERQAGDPEVLPALQDLADAVAWEASEAFTASYYPGRHDVEALSSNHVTDIMQALQREMDRESRRTGRRSAVFADLPPDRQRALAERRRWWFMQFGIDHAAWETGRFSLWKVSNKITWPPEGFYNRYNEVGRARRPGVSY